MQGNEHALVALTLQIEQFALRRIECMCIDSCTSQAREYGVARKQRDFALGRFATEQHRHLAQAAHTRDIEPGARRFCEVGDHARSPMMRTSRSSMTPNLSHTDCCTIPISASMSAALAEPVLTMKFACLGDTIAPPTEKLF